MLEVRLLGTFEVKHGQTTVRIASRPAQALFAYLILSAGTSHRREKLAGMLWPDSLEETARDNLRHALWRLRKSFPSSTAKKYIVADDITIAFGASSPFRLDAVELGNLDENVSADELISVLGEYNGELLPGFYDDWVVSEREHIFSIFEHHMARLMSLLQAEKRWQDVLDWGERWIKLGQKPESAYRALMYAHAAQGDMSKVAVTYKRCVRALRELSIQPSEETRSLYERLIAGTEHLDKKPAAPPETAFRQSPSSNLPVPLTSFIGREREVEEVKRLFSTTRLLTLAGPGGIGKTRLAMQAAREMVNLYPDGVWWVELAALTDELLVPQAVAQVLGVPETPGHSLIRSLQDHLREQEALLVLDNCEHLIAACARLADDMLSRSARLHILATSREPLGITGETVLQVPALSSPRLGDFSQLQHLEEFESIRLFAARAAAIRTDLALTRENVFAVARICQQLDGMPLALELAAARVKSLTLEDIARRLDDRLSLLTQGSRTALPRHQTLRAAIDWSHEMLSAPERLVFRRLSVFAGGFTLEAAEIVVSDAQISKSQVFDLLGNLIGRSLVTIQGQTAGSAGETRYGMLETIREYARERLEEVNEGPQIRLRHLEFFAAYAKRAQKGIYGAEQVLWYQRLDREVDNLRLALDHPPGSDLQKQFVIVSSLSLFWERGYRSEIVETLRRLLPLDAPTSQVQKKPERSTWADFFCGL